MISRLLLLLLFFISFNTHAENLFVIGASYARGVSTIKVIEAICNYPVGGKNFGLLESFMPEELQPFTPRCLSPKTPMGLLDYMNDEAAIYAQLSKAIDQARSNREFSIILIPPCVPFWLIFGGMDKKTQPDITVDLDSGFISPKGLRNLMTYHQIKPDLEQYYVQQHVIERVENFINEVSKKQRECQMDGHQVVIGIANVSPQIPALADNKAMLFPFINMISPVMDFSIPFQQGFIESINDKIQQEIAKANNPSLCLLDLASAVGEDGSITLQTAAGEHTFPFNRLLADEGDHPLHLNTTGYGVLAAAMLQTVRTSGQWPEDLAAFGDNYQQKVIQLVDKLMTETTNNEKNPAHQKQHEQPLELELD